MLLSYLRLVLFAIGLLVGVQVPGFINDYAKRVEAHLIEAQTGLSGFESTARQFFNGDLKALVALWTPTGSITRSCKARRILACNARGISPTSAEHETYSSTGLALPGQNLPDKVYIIPIHNR